MGERSPRWRRRGERLGLYWDFYSLVNNNQNLPPEAGPGPRLDLQLTEATVISATVNLRVCMGSIIT